MSEVDGKEQTMKIFDTAAQAWHDQISEKESVALWVLEQAVSIAKHRGEPVGHSVAVREAQAALVAVLEAEA